jgi:uncharacterized protein (TIGR02453 family)
MATAFPGFPKAALTFLRQLKRNNNRDWFNENKATYETAVKAPAEAFVEAINARLASFAPAYITESRKAIYRIYRDTRFSGDKTPYKTHAGALFRRSDLPKHEAGAFYVGISPEGVEFGGGVYMPGPDQVRLLREHMAENHERLEKLLKQPKLRKVAGELKGTELQRPPKGYAADHPAVDLLRRKQWYFFQTLEAELATTPKLVPTIGEAFAVMTPVVEFLNEPFAKRKHLDV